VSQARASGYNVGQPTAREAAPVKPAQFEYFAPASVAEAIALLAEQGDDVKILAGGQSLVPLMNMRLARPRVIVDINRIPDLGYIREHDGGLAIGAMTRQRAAEASALCRQRAPLLQEALGYVGHMAIRARGTVGGSVAHADPAGELPAVVTALDAELVVRGPGGQRIARPEEFFLTYLTTSLGPDEMLTEVRLPPWQVGTGWSFMEISRRHGDYALVGVACVVQVDGEGRCSDGRLVFTGVGGVPFVSTVGQDALRGERPSETLFEHVQQVVSADEALEPDSDIHASALYRKEVAGVMAKRALRVAFERAGRARATGSP
jgi:aerobic carbon-monoxide dehydrogenase medium subunit